MCQCQYLCPFVLLFTNELPIFLCMFLYFIKEKARYSYVCYTIYGPCLYLFYNSPSSSAFIWWTYKRLWCACLVLASYTVVLVSSGVHIFVYEHMYVCCMYIRYIRMVVCTLNRVFFSRLLCLPMHCAGDCCMHACCGWLWLHVDCLSLSSLLPSSSTTWSLFVAL